MAKKKLELLAQLQEIDLQVDVLKTAQAALNSELADIERVMLDARDGLAALLQRKEQLIADKAQQESSLADEQENIHRSETNMKEIKTNKEFQAVGREITSAKKQVATLEEQLLQSISQLEEVEKEIAVSEGRLAEMDQAHQERRAEKQSEIEKLQQDVDVDSMRRESIVKELPSSLAKRYDQLRAQRMGRALAYANNGYCLGCNMSIPAQMYNNLFKDEEILTCPHCNRVLMLQPQNGQ